MKEFPRFDRRIPHRKPHDSLTLRRIHDGVPIAIPSARTAYGFVLIVQLLIEKQSRLELAQVILINLRRVSERAQGDSRWIVASPEESSRVDYLLRRHRHVLVDYRSRFPFFIVSIELRPAQIREDQRFLYHLRGCR